MSHPNDMYVTPEDHRNVHAKVGVNNKGDLTVKIDIEHLYQCMSDEHKKEFMKTLAWTDDVFDDVANALVDGYATDSYNSNVFKLRKRLLEKFVPMEKNYLQTIMKDYANLKRYEQQMKSNMYYLENTLKKINDTLPPDKHIEFPRSYLPVDQVEANKLVDRIILGK